MQGMYLFFRGEKGRKAPIIFHHFTPAPISALRFGVAIKHGWRRLRPAEASAAGMRQWGLQF